MAREWNAGTYDRIAEPQEDWGRAVLLRLDAAPGARVLDAGCGSGRVTELLLEQRPDVRVVALDGSAAMLDEARRRLARHAARVEFVHADLRERLPLHDPVDATFTTAALHWITDHDRLFENLAAASTDDAVFCGQWGGEGNIRRVTDALDQHGVPWHDDKYFPGVDATRRAMERAGWVVDAAWLEPAPIWFADDAALAQWLRTVILGAQLGRMPRAAGDELVATVTRAIPDRTIDYVRINVAAHRERT